jgi:hypothetical protein
MLTMTVVCYGQTYDIKVKEAINQVTREKCKWLSSIDIDIESKSIIISEKGYYKITSYKVVGETTYYSAESQLEVISINLYSDGSGKLNLLTTNKSVEFKYSNN